MAPIAFRQLPSGFFRRRAPVLQVYGTRRKRHTDSLLAEAAQDSLAQFVPHAILAGKLRHLETQGKAQREIAESRVEGGFRRRVAQQAGYLSHRLPPHLRQPRSTRSGSGSW